MDIRTRTNQKILQNNQAGLHSWTYQGSGQNRQYLVFPGVFSPAIFLGTSFLTSEVLRLVKNGQKFLEIGCGCGVTSVEVASQLKECRVVAVDLNEEAVRNTIANMERHKAQLQVKVSDMFKGLDKDRFDIMYWNYPFHPSEYEHHSLMEKAVRDPGYGMLDRFLGEVSGWLQEGGFLLLGFSETMGDLNILASLAIKYGWKWEKLSTMEGGSGPICLLGLTK